MNTKLLIGVGVLVVLAAGLWWFMTMRAEAPTEGLTQETTTDDVQKQSGIEERNDTTPVSGVGSFLSLMRLGRDLRCEFTSVADDTDAAIAGTMYISGEQLRGDFDMQQNGEVYHSHMIQVDQMMYTWSETPQGTYGMKFSLDEASQPTPTDTSPSPVPERPVDLENEVTYDCGVWNADASMFVPPTTIEFMDMKTMMQRMMQGAYPTQ